VKGKGDEKSEVRVSVHLRQMERLSIYDNIHVFCHTSVNNREEHQIVPYVLGMSASDSNIIKVETEPRVDDRTHAFLATDPLEEHLAAVPPVMTISRPRIGKVPEIICWAGSVYLFNDRLRAIVEELEPGVHRSLPIAILTKEPFQGKTEHGTWHLMVPPPRIPALVIEETEFWGGFGREAYDRGKRHLSPVKKDPCVLDGAVIAGRHLWRLPEEFETGWFYSDELWGRIKAENMKGLDIEKYCTIRKITPTIH